MNQTAGKIGHIAVKQPLSVEIFDRDGIEYCCHAERTLEEACSELDVSPEEVTRALADPSGQFAPHQVDWNGSTCEFLILRILRKEHADLKEEIRNLRVLAKGSSELHSSADPELKISRELFEELAEELTAHMEAEEKTVFPALLEVELAYVGEGTQSLTPGWIPATLKRMSQEHRVAGRTLSLLCQETHAFHVPKGADPAYQEFYDGLTKLYGGIRHDFHVENDILFPRIAQMEMALLHETKTAAPAHT